MALPPDTPQLSDLDLLLSVERCGSVGKAARDQGISQPAASLRLRSLERKLGLRLLERSPAGTKLTHDGAVLAECARLTVDAVENLLACRSSLQGAANKSLRVAGNLATVEYLIPRWLHRLDRSLEGADVEIRADTTLAVFEQVRCGNLDLGFVTTADVPDDLSSRQIADDELVVVVGPGHPWRGVSRPLPRHELAAGPLVMRERGSGTRENIERWLCEGSAAKNWLSLPSNTAIKQAVIDHSAAAILSLVTVEREVRDGVLIRVRVEGPTPTTPVHAVWDRARGLPEFARQLLEAAADEAVLVEPTSVRTPPTRRVRSNGQRDHEQAQDVPSNSPPASGTRRPVGCAVRPAVRPTGLPPATVRAG